MAKQLEYLESSRSVRRTRLADALIAKLEEDRRAVVTHYDLFQLLRQLFGPENRKKLYLRNNTPDVEELRRVTFNLLKTGGLAIDRDYGRSLYRVLPAGESNAEEVTALANPFGHISHLSAMQRWGLTERRPEALHLTMPRPSTAPLLMEARMAADYGARNDIVASSLPVKMRFIRHPKEVRGRKISIYETKHPTRWLQVQDSHARLATVGQTFVDTVERPQYSGGMAHVIDVWRKHAAIFSEEIISTIDEIGTPIGKVRAGYLLDEVAEDIKDLRVMAWVAFAQRGSSRVLDPTKDFGPRYSEKWMLSINV